MLVEGVGWYVPVECAVGSVVIVVVDEPVVGVAHSAGWSGAGPRSHKPAAATPPADPGASPRLCAAAVGQSGLTHCVWWLFDDFYKQREELVLLVAAKKQSRTRLR